MPPWDRRLLSWPHAIWIRLSYQQLLCERSVVFIMSPGKGKVEDFIKHRNMKTLFFLSANWCCGNLRATPRSVSGFINKWWERKVKCGVAFSVVSAGPCLGPIGSLGLAPPGENPPTKVAETLPVTLQPSLWVSQSPPFSATASLIVEITEPK